MENCLEFKVFLAACVVEIVSQNPSFLQKLGKVDCRGEDITSECFVWSGLTPACPPPTTSVSVALAERDSVPLLGSLR